MDKKIVYFVVETGSLSGGVRVIGELANGLAVRGWPVEIWSVNRKESMSWFQLHNKIKWRSFLRTGTVQDYDGLADVLAKQPGWKIATFWRTAYAVAEASAEGEGLYLVQDVETSYTTEPKAAEQVWKTYGFPLRKITTSRWVLSMLPDSEYLGIGVSPYYKRLDRVSRNSSPLAIARRQALKGFSALMEIARYLHQANIQLHTFGLDRRLPDFCPVQHLTMPDGKPLTDRAVRDAYNSHGVFLSTSKHEGFGLPILEAMACGLPVVTTNAHGNMEFCEDGVNCLVRDDPRDLTDAVLELLKDKPLAQKLAKVAQNTPWGYRWSDVLDRMEKFIV